MLKMAQYDTQYLTIETILPQSFFIISGCTGAVTLVLLFSDGNVRKILLIYDPTQQTQTIGGPSPCTSL